MFRYYPRKMPHLMKNLCDYRVAPMGIGGGTARISPAAVELGEAPLRLFFSVPKTTWNCLPGLPESSLK
jgi:hypothetical protein